MRTMVRKRTAAVLERDAPECFFLFRKDDEDGPFSLEELKEMRRAGEVSPATPCRSRAGKEWHDLDFLLKNAVQEEIVAEEIGGPMGETASGAGNSLRQMVGDLVEASSRQVRVLTSIKWCLVVLICLAVGLLAARF